MADIGLIALVIAFAAAVFGMFANLVGAYGRRHTLVVAGRNALYAVSALVLLASLILVIALVQRDYSLSYVANHVSDDLPLFYTISAFWGGQAGSLLFWSLVLAGYSVAVTIGQWKHQPVLRPYVTAVLLGIQVFFLTLLLFAANPFARLWTLPTGANAEGVFIPTGALPTQVIDGTGLNPLLQNYWMVIHPLALYLGYVGFAVPFAFAVAALVTGQLGNEWIRTIRRWTLVPWMFLTAGILMGSQWAYVELGWGGFWAWDPVENASFWPWLTGTAFLHSIMIQERRGMLKIWNMFLIGLTFLLTIFGTFLTRSGIIESVHAFALSNIGPIFLAFLATTGIGFLALLVYRWDDLRSANQLDGLLSRESAFLFQNLLFVIITVVTIFGTLYPLISDFLGTVLNLPIARMSFAAPWFDKVTGPFFLGLIVLMGSAPLLAWRRTGRETLVRNFAFPVVFAVVVGVVLFFVGVRRPFSLFSLMVVSFVLGGILQEFYRGASVRRRNRGENYLVAVWTLLRRNPRRYGGYLVHLGVLCIIIAITGHNAYSIEAQANLMRGDSMQVANYELTFRDLRLLAEPSYDQMQALLEVKRDGRVVGDITPAMNFYRTVAGRDQPTNEIAIRMGLTEDLYVVLAGTDGSGASASFKAYVNPMMGWMWLGGVIMILGTLMAIWPAQGMTQQTRVKESVPGGVQPA